MRIGSPTSNLRIEFFHLEKKTEIFKDQKGVIYSKINILINGDLIRGNFSEKNFFNARFKYKINLYMLG